MISLNTAKRIVILEIISIVCTFSCIKDSLNCPIGYTGSNCNEQSTPKYLKILKINLDTFPVTDLNGLPWDSLDGPDLYFNIFYKGVEIYTTKSRPIENFSGASSSWTIVDNLNLNEPLDQYIIGVYDLDTIDKDDYIGGVLFYPYDSFNGFPSTIKLACMGCFTAWRMELEYVH